MAFALRQGGGNRRHRGVGSEAPAWQGRLPVASPRRGGGRFDTRDVVDLVLKNYQNFLVGTRA
jgi:hypothetical protein